MLGKVALRNTLKNWRHSISALLSLSASFVSLVMFDGYMYDVDNVFADNFRYKQMLGDVLIENPKIHSELGITEPWKFWLDKDQQRSIDEFISTESESIQASVKSLTFQGMASTGKRSYIFLGRGYDTQAGANMRNKAWEWNTVLGIPLHKANDPNSANIGFGLAKKMGCEIPTSFPFLISAGNFSHEERKFECQSKELQLSTTTPDGQLNAIDLNIVGVIDGGYKDLDDRFLHTSLEAAQTLMNTDQVTYYSVQLQNTSQIPQFIERFNHQIKSQYPDLTMQVWQQHPAGESYRKTMDFLRIFRNFIIIVILVVSTLSVVNTLVKIVKERTREVGTLRSIGFKKIEIIRMFVYESIYLAFFGSSIGCVFSILLSLVINSMAVTYKAGMLSNPILFQIYVVPTSYLSAFVLLIIVSLLASYISTVSILRGKIVENLIHS